MVGRREICRKPTLTAPMLLALVVVVVAAEKQLKVPGHVSSAIVHAL